MPERIRRLNRRAWRRRQFFRLHEINPYEWFAMGALVVLFVALLVSRWVR